MKSRLTVKKIKECILHELEEEISFREKERGQGMFLAENIDSYYMNVGNILLLQRLCKSFDIKTNLIDYYPYETEEDDSKYNYCCSAGGIGRIKDEKEA